MNKAIVLLSGGLDSLVALDIIKCENEIALALNFNYGQLVFKEENEAAKNIAKYYDIELKTIELPYLKALCNNALTNFENKNNDDFNSVWVPNRNGLFLNIAASFCDSLDIDKIVIGANKKEALEFSDNSRDFINAINESFKYSTLKHCEVAAPCIDFDKVDMINYAIDNKLPLSYIKSCYSPFENNKAHCGKCKSCKLLFEAIKNSKNPDIIKEIK